ncbi:OLC1v1015730C1 [Oldenlandia corymbosa var. corymbosa]|uniref:OLC1v1015730C1 n=1 Tax=Oldenlandia corymbosa var. corymbosa TaxID=529605 RepID=A0AAV1E3S4_OLDCO|nr:OLC1v1015730C1 [Oldenlandia corymbosa var. corymbosa]
MQPLIINGVESQPVVKDCIVPLAETLIELPTETLPARTVEALDGGSTSGLTMQEKKDHVVDIPDNPPLIQSNAFEILQNIDESGNVEELVHGKAQSLEVKGKEIEKANTDGNGERQLAFSGNGDGLTSGNPVAKCGSFFALP